MSFVGTLSRLGSVIGKIIPQQLSIRLRETRQKLFTKYLLLTNITISASFSGLGDFIEQSYEKLAGYQDKYDKLRTFKLTTTGIPVGIVCHFWYIFLDKRLPLRTGKTLIKKFFYDQLVGSPLYITVFFSSLAIWNNWSFHELKEKILDEGKDIYTAEWYIWPPAQFFNFYFLPTKYRLLYDSTISLGFDIYFSYVTHKHQREEKLKESNLIVEDCD